MSIINSGLSLVAEGEQGRIVSLPEQLKYNGFLYTLVKRDESKALYRQESLQSGVKVGYELFYIKLRERESAGLKTGEWYERFPNKDSFGRWAWALITKDEDKAIERFNQLSNPKKK